MFKKKLEYKFDSRIYELLNGVEIFFLRQVFHVETFILTEDKWPKKWKANQYFSC